MPWIYVANPYRKVTTSESSLGDEGKWTGEEGPPSEESDWAQFVVQGGRILEELRGLRHEIEKRNPGKAKAAVTRALNVERDAMVKKILDLAVELKCTSGKVGLTSLISDPQSAQTTRI